MVLVMAKDRSDDTARFRRGLRGALRGHRDPAPIAGQRRRSISRVGDLHTHKVLDLTIRLAEVMLSAGSGTADVVATAQDVAQAYQITDCVVDITFSTIIVSALPTADSPPLTIMRSVRSRSTDYTRLAELDKLVSQITAGGVPVDQAHEAMDELTERPHPYPRWIATAGWAGFALGIAMLLGGNWLTCILAAITSAVIDQVGRFLNRAGTPFFFQHAAGALIATLVAVAAYRFADQGPTALVATGIVVLLSGMTLVGSVQDALTGHMVTAVGRLGDVLFLTAGIVVGIVAGLQIASVAGIRIQLHVDATQSVILPTGSWSISIAVFGAALAGVCLTIASYAPLRSVVTAGFAAGLAELALIGLGHAGFGPVFATGIAAAGVGLLATLISIRRQAPALVTATAGITPMLPGLAVFRAIFSLAVDERFLDGIAQLMSAVAIALAIGSGVVRGELLGSPLRYRAGRIGEFVRIEGPPGLRRAVGRVVRLRPTEAPPTVGTVVQRTRSVALEPDTDSDPEKTDTETAQVDESGEPGNPGQGAPPTEVAGEDR
jgi:uncharacterized membrane protein YjjP (DUF1212 family)